MEFLVHSEVRIPHGSLTAERLEELTAAERSQGRERIESGELKRFWRVPGTSATWTLWELPDATALHKIITSLPMWPYVVILEVVATAAHPADPVMGHLA